MEYHLNAGAQSLANDLTGHCSPRLLLEIVHNCKPLTPVSNGDCQQWHVVAPCIPTYCASVKMAHQKEAATHITHGDKITSAHVSSMQNAYKC